MVGPSVRLSRFQDLVGGKPSERPCPALRDQLQVEVSIVKPERAEQPAVLIDCIPLDPYHTCVELEGECPTSSVAVGLAMLWRVDAQKPDPFRLSVFVEAGDRVTIVDCLDPPERLAG